MINEKTWIVGKVGIAMTRVLCSAALGLAFIGSAAAQSPSEQGAATSVAAKAGDVREARLDAMSLGLPAIAGWDLEFDESATKAWVGSMSKYSGAVGSSRVEFASYRQFDGAGISLEGGAARWTDSGCRIVMPTKTQALGALQNWLGISREKAERLGLPEMEALHELGHCKLKDGVSPPAFQGVAATDVDLAMRAVFDPAWSFVDKEGLGARMWSESFADAFMAIESLASSSADAASREALGLLAKGRARSGISDGDAGHSKGYAIQAALERSSEWNKLASNDRLAAAAQIATRAALRERGNDGLLRVGSPKTLSEGLSAQSMELSMLEDAGFRWAQAEGAESLYEGVDIQGASGSLGEALGRLAQASKAAMKDAGAGSPGALDEAGQRAMVARAHADSRVANARQQLEAWIGASPAQVEKALSNVLASTKNPSIKSAHALDAFSTLASGAGSVASTVKAAPPAEEAVHGARPTR